MSLLEEWGQRDSRQSLEYADESTPFDLGGSTGDSLTDVLGGTASTGAYQDADIFSLVLAERNIAR